MSFVLNTELRELAGKVAGGTSTADSLRELLALTIAVVGATESLYQSLGRPRPTQWESLERSAETVTNEHVVKWVANADPDLKRAITQQRRRKLVAGRSGLSLVESDRNKRARWAKIFLPPDAAIPIDEAASEGLADAMLEAEERLYQHLNEVGSTEPLVLAGQVVGLLCASECLLALFPSNRVAAFRVQLAAMNASQ